MHKLSSRAFTLMEIMIVIAALGILTSALIPSFTNYQKRWRDIARIAHLNSAAKIINNFFIDKWNYPSNTAAGCVDSVALNSYGKISSDPLTSNNNWCSTLGQYAYGSSSLLTNSANEFILFAKMENPNGGNYNTGSMAGLTGTLQQVAFNNVLANVRKGSGQYQVMTR